MKLSRTKVMLIMIDSALIVIFITLFIVAYLQKREYEAQQRKKLTFHYAAPKYIRVPNV